MGKIYEITTFVAGDDFENVADVLEGTINTTGCIFKATGTTPTTWTNSSELKRGGSFEDVKYDSKNLVVELFYFEWKEPISDTLDWMTKEIFIPLNCFPIIKADGKVYLQVYKQPTVLDLPTFFDDSNIATEGVTSNDID